jgi:hypothetical protein
MKDFAKVREEEWAVVCKHIKPIEEYKYSTCMLDSIVERTIIIPNDDTTETSNAMMKRT